MDATPIPRPDEHQELREAVRALCRRFDSAYWQQVDEARGYPEAFVDALTEAGWLAALIPQEYGGSGPRPDRGLGGHGGDQPLGRQRRQLPRPDVQHGHAAAARLARAEAAVPAGHRDRRAAAADHGA